MGILFIGQETARVVDTKNFTAHTLNSSCYNYKFSMYSHQCSLQLYNFVDGLILSYLEYRRTNVLSTFHLQMSIEQKKLYKKIDECLSVVLILQMTISCHLSYSISVLDIFMNRMIALLDFSHNFGQNSSVSQHRLLALEYTVMCWCLFWHSSTMPSPVPSR